MVAGFILGIGMSYLFLARQISDLNERIEQINQRLLLDVPATTAATAIDPVSKSVGGTSKG